VTLAPTVVVSMCESIVHVMSPLCRPAVSLPVPGSPRGLGPSFRAPPRSQDRSTQLGLLASLSQPLLPRCGAPWGHTGTLGSPSQTLVAPVCGQDSGVFLSGGLGGDSSCPASLTQHSLEVPRFRLFSLNYCTLFCLSLSPSVCLSGFLSFLQRMAFISRTNPITS